MKDSGAPNPGIDFLTRAVAYSKGGCETDGLAAKEMVERVHQNGDHLISKNTFRIRKPA
ncbi:hypothetical protein [Duganella sp. Root1480D1]|uniref:hypothetical protein n=1 Tax=Duganella sp. Root1480D1 TaxID=1736471 RepID=UPI0012E34596|nr:hypothetical protein [Duganella sp. Root1480D1]